MSSSAGASVLLKDERRGTSGEAGGLGYGRKKDNSHMLCVGDQSKVRSNGCGFKLV